jgi:hypothetical protein
MAGCGPTSQPPEQFRLRVYAVLRTWSFIFIVDRKSIARPTDTSIDASGENLAVLARKTRGQNGFAVFFFRHCPIALLLLHYARQLPNGRPNTRRC